MFIFENSFIEPGDIVVLYTDNGIELRRVRFLNEEAICVEDSNPLRGITSQEYHADKIIRVGSLRDIKND